MEIKHMDAHQLDVVCDVLSRNGIIPEIVMYLNEDAMQPAYYGDREYGVKFKCRK